MFLFSELMSVYSATLASASRSPVPRKNRHSCLSSSLDTRNKSSSSCRVYASGGHSTYLILMLTSVIGGPARRPSLLQRNVTTYVMRLWRVRSSSTAGRDQASADRLHGSCGIFFRR